MSYTSNISEKIRLDIGKMLLLHEFKKLFPDLKEDPLQTMEEKLDKLITEIQSNNVVSIRNFWNLVNSIMMGYELKEIVSKITSACFDWTTQTIEIEDLKFASDVTRISGFDINKKTAKEVSEYLKTHLEDLNAVKEGAVKSYPENDTRHSDPILVLDEGDGNFVHDGNGRLLRAIVNGDTTLSAYIGTKNSKTRSDHWVPTSYLMYLNEEIKTSKSALELLEKVLDSSLNAKYEYENRII